VLDLYLNLGFFENLATYALLESFTQFEDPAWRLQVLVIATLCRKNGTIIVYDDSATLTESLGVLAATCMARLDLDPGLIGPGRW
jgi:hypothetical protein